MPRLAAGGRAADAREQPAPRRRREARGAVVYGGIGKAARNQSSYHTIRRELTRLGDDGDAARAVGQAGRRVRDPRARAAGADRQHEPRARVGDLGALPRARRGRADHVRPDDRRVLDLHRQPGDPAGHLRDVRRRRPQALRRHAARPAGRDRRARRHGRRAAAGDHDGRRHRAVHRGRPAAHRAPDRRPATSTSARPTSTTRWRGWARPRARRARRCRSACWATRPRSCPSWSAATSHVDVVTDQTSAHDPLNGYVPAGPDRRAGRRAARRATPTSTCARVGESALGHVGAIRELGRRGAEAFDYGNALRGLAAEHGDADAFAYPGFVPAYIRPLFCEGKGPFRWVALSGDPAGHPPHRRGDPRPVRRPGAHRALDPAGPRARSTSRACRRGSAGWATASAHLAGLRFNEMVASGELQRPDRDRPRPPRLRLGGLARARDRGDAATARTRSPTGRSSTRC